jgi:hypothetical protein
VRHRRYICQPRVLTRRLSFVIFDLADDAEHWQIIMKTLAGVLVSVKPLSVVVATAIQGVCPSDVPGSKYHLPPLKDTFFKFVINVHAGKNLQPLRPFPQIEIERPPHLKARCCACHNSIPK